MRFRLVGGVSGFKTFRDLGLFAVGAFIAVFHVASTPAAELQPTVLVISGGLMGAPLVLDRDEKKE